MNAKKTLLAGLTVSAISLAGIGGASVLAATTTSGDTLADKIAQKFNLNKDDVQKVIDEERAAHQAEHKERMEERLDKAVTDGKLTEDQKSKIVAKLEEMQTFRDSLKDKTHEERHDAMEAKREELKKWAEENDIPTGFFPLGKGMHGKGMGMGHRGMQE